MRYQPLRLFRVYFSYRVFLQQPWLHGDCRFASCEVLLGHHFTSLKSQSVLKLTADADCCVLREYLESYRTKFGLRDGAVRACTGPHQLRGARSCSTPISIVAGKENHTSGRVFSAGGPIIRCSMPGGYYVHNACYCQLRTDPCHGGSACLKSHPHDVAIDDVHEWKICRWRTYRASEHSIRARKVSPR